MTPASQTRERRVVRLGRVFLSGGVVTSEAGATARGMTAAVARWRAGRFGGAASYGGAGGGGKG